MRLSTAIKHKYQDKGIRVLRAIQDQSMIRLTVPINTPYLNEEIRRVPADTFYGPSKNRLWLWINPAGTG